VSIITPTFNSAQTLERTISSVLTQTYDNIEYIIIDGGSTDGTLDIVRKHENGISRWVSEPDGGVSDAFNKGIAHSTGDIIGILNSDDWYERDAVAHAVERLKASGADIAYGMLLTWNEEGPLERVAADHEMLDREMSINHPAVFVLRKAYETAGLFRTDFSYAMDYEWLLRAKKAGLKFSPAEKCVVNMQLKGLSDMHWRKALEEERRAKNLSDPSIVNDIFHIYKVGKGSLRRVLERAGFGFVVRFFHANMSSVQKVKAKD
jgi:glycosyltransferase involved in cell wall biosynthesis